MESYSKEVLKRTIQDLRCSPNSHHDTMTLWLPRDRRNHDLRSMGDGEALSGEASQSHIGENGDLFSWILMIHFFS